jgi:hypothetical protein
MVSFHPLYFTDRKRKQKFQPKTRTAKTNKDFQKSDQQRKGCTRDGVNIPIRRGILTEGILALHVVARRKTNSKTLKSRLQRLGWGAFFFSGGVMSTTKATGFSITLVIYKTKSITIYCYY